jgi:nucleotide-binding universal stress UspA family protein
MKVLIGVDGSDAGMEAVRQVGPLLAPKTDSVWLYHSPPILSVQVSGTIDPGLIERARQTFAATVLKEARDNLPEALRANVHEIVGVQDPRHGLMVAADERRVDLIAVGARGLGTIERWFLGSVSRSVAHAATVPVFVARPRAIVRRGLRVLLACSLTELSHVKAELLNRFTWPEGTVGRVITVVESLFGADIPEWLKEQARTSETEQMAQTWLREHEAAVRAKYSELAAFCHKLAWPFQAEEPLIVEGNPADRILEAVAEHGIDLVVIGSHGGGGVTRWLLGSNSERVLTHAPCSVLIVRQHERP